MMNTVRSSIEDSFEWEQVYIIMNTNCPKTSHETMCENQVDWQWNEIAAREDRQGLKESIHRMECETRIWCNRLRSVMNIVQLIVHARQMKQSVDPICEELVIDDVQNNINWEHIRQIPIILNFGVVRIADLYQSYQWHLASNVINRPFYVQCLLFFVLTQLLHLRGEFVMPPFKQNQIGQGAGKKVQKKSENISYYTGRDELINQGRPNDDHSAQYLIGMTEVGVRLLYAVDHYSMIHATNFNFILFNYIINQSKIRIKNILNEHSLFFCEFFLQPIQIAVEFQNSHNLQLCLNYQKLRQQRQNYRNMVCLLDIQCQG